MSIEICEPHVLPKRLKDAITNQIPRLPHDVILCAGKDLEKISGHKLILSIASPFLQNQFNKLCYLGRSVKRRRSKIIAIDFPDLDPVGVKNVVQYAYSRHLDVSATEATVTMLSASKFEIPELFEYCASLVSIDANDENLVLVYQSLCHLTDNTSNLKMLELKEKAFYRIVKNFGKVMRTSQFCELTSENLSKFLKMDSLFVKSEVDIFKEVKRWAEKQCILKDLTVCTENYRLVLTDILPLIRFPTMDVDEFITEVEPTGILTLKSCHDLYKYFSVSPNKRPKLCEDLTMNYNFTKRDGAIRKYEFTAVFYLPQLQQKTHQEEEKPNGCSLSDLFKIVQTANAKLLKLKSIGIIIGPNSCSNSEMNKVKVKLMEFDSELKKFTVVAEIRKGIMTDKSSEITYIRFEEPILTHVNRQYKIVVTSVSGTLAVYSKETLKALKLQINFPQTPETSFIVHMCPNDYIIRSLKFEYC